MTPVSKRMKFPIELSKGGIVKQSGLGDNVQGRVTMRGARGSISVECSFNYLNERFFRSMRPGEELELEISVRKK